MNNRPILHVVREFSDRSDKLAKIHEGYRVAAEAYRLASDLGCSGDLFDALWSLVEREAKTAELKRAELRDGDAA